jgi:hypothetical protein
MAEYKTAFHLEAMVAEIAGFDPKNIHVTRVGKSGDFGADFVGTVAAVNTSRAKHDVDVACNSLKARFRLKD